MPSIAQVAALYPDIGKPSLYRHVSNGHVGRKEATALDRTGHNAQALTQNTQREISATLRDARRLFRKATKHLDAATSADDLKATNGAISAATKALELIGKLRGELQQGAQVNVAISVEQRNAMDSLAAVADMSAADVIEQAERLLAAYLEARDAHAVAAVGRLLRMLPSGAIEPESA